MLASAACLWCVPQPVPAAPSTAAGSTNVYPIDLLTVLRLADTQSLEIERARLRLEEAQANLESATEQFFPWVAPAAGFRRHEKRTQAVDGTLLDADFQAYSAGAGVAAQVNLGDAIYNSLAAKQVVRAAGHDVEARRRDTILAAAEGYFELAKARGLVGVFGEAYRIAADYQDQLHRAVQTGIAFKGDELRAQVQTERYQISLRQAREQERVAGARLSEVLHLDATVALVAREEELAPLTLIAPDSVLETLVSEAFRARPEWTSSQALVAAAQESWTGSRYGPLIPSVGAQGFAGGLGGGPGGSTGGFAQSADFTVGLGWRIGPGGLLDRGRIHASQARLATAKLNQARLKDAITREVVENQTRVQSLMDQLATTKTNLTSAAETLRLTRDRKQFGVGIVLEDIQAQQELARARADYLTAIAEYDKAQYGLSRAIGRLDQHGASRRTPPK